MKRLLTLSLLLLAVLAGDGLAEPPALPKGIIAVDGRPAPPLRLEDMDGNAFDLESVRGRWAFVHFWASWCAPCRREMPAIERMAQRLPADFALVVVNTAETEDDVFSFLSAVAPELHTLMDYDGLATEPWQPRGLPATYLVDPDGRIRYQALGGRPWDEPVYLNFLHALAARR